MIGVDVVPGGIMQVFNVLVFPCGSEISLEIHRSLQFSVHVNLFGASSRDDHGRYLYRQYDGGLPYISDSGFIEAFNAVLEERNIDYIFPTHDTVALHLAENRTRLSAAPLNANLHACQVAREKRLIYDLFADCEFCPIVYKELGQTNTFPVFIKPNRSEGGKGCQVINDGLEWQHYHNGPRNDCLVLEYLPGEEYTVDCFTDRNGRLRFCGARTRSRILAGISVQARRFPDNGEFLCIAEEINQRVVMSGAWFFQVKRSSTGQLKLLEFAPRVPSTMGLYRNLGINFPLLTVYNAAGYDLELVTNEYAIELDRAFINRYRIEFDYQAVYMDLDDTLLQGDRVNPQVMLFMYQQRNHGKRIHLLTSHRGNLMATLQEQCICPDLFTEIHHITNTQEKADYIRDRPAVFVDNSFNERKKAKCPDVAVFDVDAIESLIDWRGQ